MVRCGNLVMAFHLILGLQTGSPASSYNQRQCCAATTTFTSLAQKQADICSDYNWG
jgi:hypothetical protein